MKKSKFMLSLFIAIAMLGIQTGSVLAAPNLNEGVINGTVTALECVTDEGTSILVTFDDEEGVSQQTEIDLETAISLGLVTIGEGDVPDCSPEAFQAIIDALNEPQHPVGAALSLFFEDLADYDTIMEAHENGTGFGVIAQALWLTLKMEGDTNTFLDIIAAKESGDFSKFALEDGTIPQNWGQFKKAVLNGDKKSNLGAVMSAKDDDQEEKTNKGKGQDKDKDNQGNNKGQND